MIFLRLECFVYKIFYFSNWIIFISVELEKILAEKILAEKILAEKILAEKILAEKIDGAEWFPITTVYVSK
jgi:hypothetical protein